MHRQIGTTARIVQLRASRDNILEHQPQDIYYRKDSVTLSSVEGEITERTPELHLIAERVKKAIEQTLANIPNRDRKIFCMRFAIGYPRQFTYDEIEARMCIPADRCKRIQYTTLKRLKQGGFGMEVFREVGTADLGHLAAELAELS